MILYWRQDTPEAWQHLEKSCIINIATGGNVFHDSVAFMQKFHERHIPISEEILAQWEKEANICGSTHGQKLKQDIKWARKCNERQDEVMVFND